MTEELIEEAFDRFQADNDEFHKAISTDDALGAAIRAAIYIEHQIIKLIEENVYSTKAIDRMKLTYERRLNRAIALGLREDLASPLKALGNIRNNFTHMPYTTLGNAEANNFYNSFVPDDRLKLEHIYQRSRKYPTLKSRRSSLPLSPLERFSFCALIASVLSFAGVQLIRPLSSPRQSTSDAYAHSPC